jgi:hypothetical protein
MDRQATVEVAVMRESDVARKCDKKLRAARWFVAVFSQDKSPRSQLSGFPDRACFRDGYTVLIEYKAPGGELSPSQIEFYARIAPHLGEYLRLYVIDNPDYGIPQWMLK